MILTDEQMDALTELINIAFSRTAASLSDLTGHRVLLGVPKISVHPMGQLYQTLSGVFQGEVATVHQIFSGVVSGDAFLILDIQGASILSDLLTSNPRPTGRIDASAQEVLLEVGNILLNACLGMFGNLLKVHVSFSVPRLHLEELGAMMASLTVGQEGIRYALIMSTTFSLRDQSIRGYLVLVLGVASLDRLIQAVEQWAKVNLHPKP